MRYCKLDELKCGDIFSFEGKKWIKVHNPQYNALSTDGKQLEQIPENTDVIPRARKINMLDLRVGDLCRLDAVPAYPENTKTVVKIKDVDDYRYITFMRPYLDLIDWHDLNPENKARVEKFTDIVSLKDPSDKYVYLLGINVTAISGHYKELIYMSDKYRIATFLKRMNDGHYFPELLCMDGIELQHRALDRLWSEYLKKGERPPEYPPKNNASMGP